MNYGRTHTSIPPRVDEENESITEDWDDANTVSKCSLHTSLYLPLLTLDMQLR